MLERERMLGLGRSVLEKEEIGKEEKSDERV